MNQTHRIPAAVLACTVLIASTGPAIAADCTLSATGLAFPGAYDPIGAHATADLDGTNVIRFTCTRTRGGAERVSFSLSLSTGAAGGYLPRKMSAGTATLDYNLFTNATRSTIWGNGTSGTSTVAGSFTLNPARPTQTQNHTVYGRIPRAQDAANGSYLDSITVTLTF